MEFECHRRNVHALLVKNLGLLAHSLRVKKNLKPFLFRGFDCFFHHKKLNVDKDTNVPLNRGEVSRLLGDPHPVGSFADLPQLAATDRLFLAVAGELGGEFSTPLVELLV